MIFHPLKKFLKLIFELLIPVFKVFESVSVLEKEREKINVGVSEAGRISCYVQIL